MQSNVAAPQPRTRFTLGLYGAKYTLRRWLDHVPGVTHLSPNAVSVSSLVPSGLAALALWQGWWAWVVVGVAGRMVLTTLDGLIAESYDKKTRAGPWFNRFPQEIGDVLLLLALAAIVPFPWGVLALGLAWLVNVFAVLGMVAGGSFQPVGPGGQPDRIAVVALAALLALVVPVSWQVVAQLLCVLMAISLVLRARRTWRELSA